MSTVIKLIHDAGHLKHFAGMVPGDIFRLLPGTGYFLVGALEDMRPVGAAVLQYHGQYGELLSVFVAEERRHQDVGSQLLLECVRLLRFLSTQGMYAVLTPEHEDVAGLLAHFGMEQEEDDEAWEFTLEQVEDKLPRAQKPHTLALSKVPSAQYNVFVQKEFSGSHGPVARDCFDPELSRVVVEHNAVTGAILIQRLEDAISVGWFQASPADRHSALHLIQDAISAAVRSLPMETRVRFLSGSDPVLQLADKLVGTNADRWTEQRWIIEDANFRLIGLQDDGLPEEEEV